MAYAQPGSVVHVRGEDWRVARVDAYERCAVLTLDGGPGRPRLRIIEPFDRPRVRRVKPRQRRRRAVLRTALAAIANSKPPLGLWTAAGAAIDLLPYQLEPALAVLRGATRLLLADAVGLGKTIEAGLILSELRARGWVERALIVCPPGLRAIWATELGRRFNIAAAIVDQAVIAETIAALPPGINPWSGHAVIITSIDLAKREEVRAALDDIAFDVLIADEAHHLTPGTDRGEMVGRIAARTPWCVFLSATPHSGDEAAFKYLAGLGSHGDPLTVFRRSGAEIGRSVTRRERVVRVRPSGGEIRMLEAAASYASAIWHGRGAHDSAVRLVAITISRRAASSPLALQRTLRRRRALLAATPEPEQTALPWDEDDSGDDEMAARMLSRPGLENGLDERSRIERLLRLADEAPSAKLRWLVRFLSRAGEPAIVFTEYRDTLEEILGALPPSLRAVAITGGHSPEWRRVAVDAFNGGDSRVLVATDTAGEGLSLHHRCRLVIDFELPWNPMRLEQRVGRVDRLGQRRPVHAVRLIHPESIEERVLDRLRERRSLSEAEVAQWVFGASAEAPRATWSPASAAIPAAVAEVERLAAQRKQPCKYEGGVVARLADAARFVAVHRITFANALGNVVCECPAAHRVDSHRAAALAACLREQAGRQRIEIESALAPLRTAIGNRISRIQSSIAAMPRGFQQSLFDTRAEAAARKAAIRRGNVHTALTRRRETIVAPISADGAVATVVAAWPSSRP